MKTRDANIVVHPGLATHLSRHYHRLLCDWNIRCSSRKNPNLASRRFGAIRISLREDHSRSFQVFHTCITSHFLLNRFEVLFASTTNYCYTHTLNHPLGNPAHILWLLPLRKYNLWNSLPCEPSHIYFRDIRDILDRQQLVTPLQSTQAPLEIAHRSRQISWQLPDNTMQELQFKL